MTRRKTNWPRISEAVRYFLVSLVPAVTGFDLIPAIAAKWICFSLGIVILGLKGLDMVLNPPKQQA